jgi:hypothetical protein
MMEIFVIYTNVVTLTMGTDTDPTQFKYDAMNLDSQNVR